VQRIVFGISGILVAASIGAAGLESQPWLDTILTYCELIARVALDWYSRTPPTDRIIWGGMAACVVVGAVVTLERSFRLRRHRIIPTALSSRFLPRLAEGQLDRGKALDYCEINSSPAARVALAAIRRWGRPVSDMERGVAMARQIETDRLRRRVGTVRRVAILVPLLGLVGSLTTASRILSLLGGGEPVVPWGPSLATALTPVTAGIALAILAVVAYDGLAARVEQLENELDRVGAETVDAIAAIATIEPSASRPRTDGASATRTPHSIQTHAREEVRPTHVERSS
jgi:biopolymer transport protein ExbB